MPSEPSTDITQSERYRSRHFESVVKAYVQCLERPPLWQDVEFKVDVERATHAALDGLDLFPVWEQLVSGETVPMNKRARVAAACSRLYIERGLLPFTYFAKKHLRMYRPERKTAA